MSRTSLCIKSSECKDFYAFLRIHINELTFRHIVTKFDRPTSLDKSKSRKFYPKLTLSKKAEIEPILFQENLLGTSQNISNQMSTE